MKTFLISLLDWIYKKKCYFCGSSKDSLKMCPDCFEEMDYLPVEINRQVSGVDVYCTGVYESNLQKLIRGVKYHNQRDLAYFQAKFMYDYWQKAQNEVVANNFQVVPVPMFKDRESQRKYNHMVLVGEEFCKLSGYELNLGLVERIKDTKQQYRLNKVQRMENLANAFKINKKNISGGKILLIDDICTTGSTFENIIVELKKSEIDDITCLATTTPFLE